MTKSAIKLSPDIKKALFEDANIANLWNDLTPVSQRDFVTWIESAKQPETRARRIGIAKSKLLSGDRRPCCYAVVPMKLYKALDENMKAKAKWKLLSSMEKRDVVSWVDEKKGTEEYLLRVDKACAMLASGTLSLS